MTPVKVVIPWQMHRPSHRDPLDGESPAEQHPEGAPLAVSFEGVSRG